MAACGASYEVSKEEEDLPFNIAINIEGRTFHTSDSTTNTLPESLLGALNTNSKYFNTKTKAYCFDRDSNLFPHILAAHRDGEVHVPQDVCAVRFRKELEFWRIPKSLIAPCCWKYYYSNTEDLDTLSEIISSLPNPTHLIPKECFHILNSKKPATEGTKTKDENDESSCRHKVWQFLDEPRSSRAAKTWCTIYLIVVLISVILNLIWLEKGFRVEPYLMPYQPQGNATYNEKITRLLFTDPHKSLLTLDCICTLFFAIENCIHFAACPYKKRYMLNYFHFTKTMLTLCMIYSSVFEIRKDWLTNETVAFIWFLVRSMNTLRALLFYSVRKFSNTVNVLFLASFNAWKELVILLLMLFLMVFMYGGLIFALEMDSDMFPDTLSSMWWALITMTTIGYGDFHPTRPMGYVIGTFCAVEGIMMIALPIAVMASVFSKYKDRNDDLENHLESIEQEKIELIETRKEAAESDEDAQKELVSIKQDEGEVNESSIGASESVDYLKKHVGTNEKEETKRHEIRL